LLNSSLDEKLLVALLGELAILYAGSGGGGKKESDADVALVLECDRAVDGREDEKLLFRSFLNMLSELCVFVYAESKATQEEGQCCTTTAAIYAPTVLLGFKA
jgi:hypothetical protein